MRTAWKLGVSLCIALFACNAYSDNQYIGKEAADKLPIFDAHIHYKEPAWQPYPPESVIRLMDESGVAMGLVSSTPDEGTIKLWKHAPDRIVPELRPYHDGYGSSNWMRMPGMDSYLEKRLDAYPHEGIGEFHLHGIGADDPPLLRKIAKMALERDLYIHVHSGAGPVKFLFKLEPKLKIIWAHAGMSEPANVVYDMMKKYDKLWADTSYREWDILESDGSINPEWRKVLEAYPDRFMVGSDTWVNSQWDNYAGLIRANRSWLAEFSREHAEMFAYKNAERLFKREIKTQFSSE